MPISVFAFVIVVLAVFRVTRFFIHDSLIGADRDSGSRFSVWLDTKCFDARGKDKSWTRGKIHDLLSCPYCLGFWFSLAGTCIALRTSPWHLGIDGWFVVWAVAGAAALTYQAMLKMMR